MSQNDRFYNYGYFSAEFPDAIQYFGYGLKCFKKKSRSNIYSYMSYIQKMHVDCVILFYRLYVIYLDILLIFYRNVKYMSKDLERAFFFKKKVEFKGNIYISRGWDIYMNIYSRKEFCLRLLSLGILFFIIIVASYYNLRKSLRLIMNTIQYNLEHLEETTTFTSPESIFEVIVENKHN